MKKFSLIFILISSVVTGELFCQQAFYDALVLSKLTIPSKEVILDQGNDTIYQILENYVPDSLKKDKNKIRSYFNHSTAGKPDPNPFIEISGSQHSLRENSFLSGFPRNISAVGSLNVTNFAEGLATFLVQRSKEELNVTFFRKFQGFLEIYPAVQVIFPATYDFLQEIYSYQYAAMLPALKAAFQKDFNAFTINIINLRDTSKYEGYSTKVKVKAKADEIIKSLNTPEGRSLIGALIATNSIVQGNNIAEIISNIAWDKICTDFPDDNFTNAIQFAELLSQSLRSIDKSRVWITKQQVNELVNNEIALKIYLGLVYATDQKNIHHIQFTLGGSLLTLQNILRELNEKWTRIEATKFRESFAEVANAMSEAADNVKKIIEAQMQGEQCSILQYAYYASSISDFLKLSVNFLSDNTGIDPSLSNLTQDVLKFTSVVDDAVACFYDLKSQNYSSLVLHTSLLLSKALDSDYAFRGDYIRYGTFMANIVEAKSPDEVNAAIEAAVLPVGSSSIKRETYFNISLNAFIGPDAGFEYLPKLDIGKWAFVTGVTAPVGVAFSWGNLCNGKRNGPKINKQRPDGKDVGGKSITIFIPVIDVGSIASFRLGNDSSKVASEVKLANIISPGIYLYYGFGKCPISVGLGGQLGPMLREVTATNINIDKNYYFKVGFNLVVDIPFFNLYTKN